MKTAHRLHLYRIAKLATILIAIAASLHLARASPDQIAVQIAGVIPLTLILTVQGESEGWMAGEQLAAEEDFTCGDWIESGPYAGVVLSRGVRRSRLRRADGRIQCVPNTFILNNGCTIGQPPAA